MRGQRGKGTLPQQKEWKVHSIGFAKTSMTIGELMMIMIFSGSVSEGATHIIIYVDRFSLEQQNSISLDEANRSAFNPYNP